jgi:hypothetical protein
MDREGSIFGAYRIRNSAWLASGEHSCARHRRENASGGHKRARPAIPNLCLNGATAID